MAEEDTTEDLSVGELEEALQLALENEDYERASQIRDQINKLKNQGK
jgi:protein-arginine kinase activator protein McsA